MPYYNNPGTNPDEAINVVDGRVFTVVQVANPDGDLVDSSSTSSRVPTTTSVASSTDSVEILELNELRKGLSISNLSTAKLYLSFVSPATLANCFIEIPAGAFILLDQQLIVPNAIYGFWEEVNGTAQVTEYV